MQLKMLKHFAEQCNSSELFSAFVLSFLSNSVE